MTAPPFHLKGPQLRFVLEPDEVLPPRAGGTADDNQRVQAGQVLLSALADARDELARRLSLVNAGIAGLTILVPAFGLVTLVAGDSFADVERVISSVDGVLGGTGPRLLERIGNGEADRLESLRVLVANVTGVVEQTIADVEFGNSAPMRFLREVLVKSTEDLGHFIENLPDKLPQVGIGIGLIAFSLWLLSRILSR